MNRSVYHPYRPTKRRIRLQKSKNRLFVQFIVCIVLVVVIIGVKRVDLAVSNKVVDVFAGHMEKDASLSSLFYTGTEKARELRDAFKTVSTRILSDDSTFALNMPADATDVIPVFADDGRQVGMDFVIPENELQVYAAAAGTITEIGTSDKIGKYVKVNHAKDIYTIYGHCSVIYTNPMEKVKKGDIIASVDKTESPVFRFEMYQDGKAVNPNDFFKQ